MTENKTPKTSTHNDKLIIGLIVGTALGFVIYWSLGVVAIQSEIIFIILIVVAIIMALLLVILVWFRNLIIKRFFGKDIAFNTLINDTQETVQLLSEKVTNTLKLKDNQKEQLIEFAPKLINYIIWSNFRNWGLRIFTSFILGLGGLVTTILVLNQNKLFENQNKLVEIQNKMFAIQNKRIEQQTHLIEAERRSAQVFIMGEVLSDLNKELEDSTNTKRILSNTLVGRIISLSRAMKPYRYLKSDSLTKKYLSPERGQLLISLIESKIDSSFFVDRILRHTTFSFADLKNVNLSSVNLIDVDLFGADLSGSILFDTNLRHADLRYVNLRGAYLKNANISYAALNNADLSYSNLWVVELIESDLYGANLMGARLSGADLSGADLSNTELIDAELALSTGSIPVKSLENVKVNRFDWLTYIKDSLKLKGANQVYEAYRVDSVEYNRGSKGKEPMLKRIIKN